MKALAIKNIGIEGTGTLGRYLSKKGATVQTVDLQNGDACPKSADQFDIIIILGGPMNVYETEKYPFLLDEMKLIEDALKKNKKIIGFCLGAQLLASAFGAKVFKNSAKEIGWHDVSLTEKGTNSNLFASLPKQFKVFQWHGDTFNLPSSALHLAKSELCKNQAFSLGNAIALQFHIEVGANDIGTWCDSYSAELQNEKGNLAKSVIEDDTKKYLDATSLLAEKFYNNLLI